MQSIAVAAQKYQNYLPQRSENCSEGHVYWTSHFSHVCIETHYDLGSSHPSASPTKNYDYFNSFVPAVQDLPGTSLDWKKMICCQKPGFWETDWKKKRSRGLPGRGSFTIHCCNMERTTYPKISHYIPATNQHNYANTTGFAYQVVLHNWL
jgi:hypothetical protein